MQGRILRLLNRPRTTEHRFSPRAPLRLHVKLYSDKRCLGAFATRNLSYRGIFVETGSIGLLCGSPVEVGLAVPGVPARFVLNAMVVHYSGDGAGLLFGASNAESLSAIRGLVRSAI
jgi:hypothetical protein